MTSRIEGNENIAALFSIFHDGHIVFRSLTDGELSIEVEVLYLTERIDPAFERFFVILYGAKDLRFSPWWREELEDGSKHLEDVEQIFEHDLVVLQGEAKDGQLEICCGCDDRKHPYSGGMLYLMAIAATVCDEAGKFYSVDELGSLCSAYWDEWEKTNRCRIVERENS